MSVGHYTLKHFIDKTEYKLFCKTEFGMWEDEVIMNVKYNNSDSPLFVLLKKEILEINPKIDLGETFSLNYARDTLKAVHFWGGEVTKKIILGKFKYHPMMLYDSILDLDLSEK